VRARSGVLLVNRVDQPVTELPNWVYLKNSDRCNVSHQLATIMLCLLAQRDNQGGITSTGASMMAMVMGKILFNIQHEVNATGGDDWQAGGRRLSSLETPAGMKAA
jgi:hypothetical protein